MARQRLALSGSRLHVFRTFKIVLEKPVRVRRGQSEPMDFSNVGYLVSQCQENVMKLTLIIAAVAGICAAVPASAEEVGVGVGPVGVTVGAGHDRDRDRDRDRTVIRDRDEHRDRDTVIIKKDHDRDGDRDHDRMIIDRH